MLPDSDDPILLIVVGEDKAVNKRDLTTTGFNYLLCHFLLELAQRWWEGQSQRGGGGRCVSSGRELGLSTLLSCCAAIASHGSPPVTSRLFPAASLRLFSILVGVPRQGYQMKKMKMVTINPITQKGTKQSVCRKKDVPRSTPRHWVYVCVRAKWGGWGGCSQ